MKPSSRRSKKPAAPISRHRPRKCRLSQSGQSHPTWSRKTCDIRMLRMNSTNGSSAGDLSTKQIRHQTAGNGCAGPEHQRQRRPALSTSPRSAPPARGCAEHERPHARVDSQRERRSATSFTKNTVCTALCSASVVNNASPVAALMRKPVHTRRGRTPKRRQRNIGADAQHAKVHHDACADDDRHADGVKRQDRWIRKQRRRARNPVGELGVLQPRIEFHREPRILPCSA